MLGTSDSAHADERAPDVEAPGFRNSTLAGTVRRPMAITFAVPDR